MAGGKTNHNPAAGLCLFVAFLTAACLIDTASARTTYRIGLAESEPEGEFVQLSWEDLDATQGFIEAMEIKAGSIAPEKAADSTNIAPSILGSGFSLLRGQWIFPEKMMAWQVERFSNWMIDGDSTTVYQCLKGPPGHNCGSPDYTYMFNLKKQVHLDRIRFFAPAKTRITIPRFIIGSNDGDQRLDGMRDYTPPGQQSRDTYDFDILHDGAGGEYTEIDFPPTPTERLLFQVFRNLDGGSIRADWEVTEFEIYAIGFAPFARYTSNIIDLGEKVNIGPLKWEGRQDPDTRIELRMRSGNDDEPNIYWRNTFRGNEKVPFTSRGAPLTQAQYNKLEIAQLGGITHDLENWSSWSTSYNFEAREGRSTATEPRRFVQFDVAFHSTPKAGGQLDYLEFATSPRLVTEARAEITPAQAPADEITSFTYKMRPQVEPGDAGFDGINIETPAQVDTETGVESVRLSGESVDFEITQLNERGFSLILASPIGLEHTEELLEIEFRAQIFAYDTPFSGRLFASTAPSEVPQAVREGDADEGVESNTLRVALSKIPQSSIQAMRLSSKTFSPNGDGFNDVLQIDYELLNLSSGTPALIQVYDLAGRRVAQIAGNDGGNSGLAHALWDGRNDQGALLTPGLYLLQLKVDADESEDRIHRPVALVY